MVVIFPIITGIGRFGRLGVVLGSSNYLSASPGSLGFSSCSAVKNLPALQETWVQSLGRENPGDLGSVPELGESWKRAWQPIPVFLPEGFHGQRSLAGCSP